ncbi:MAG: hypothetical protein JW891_17415 [Candidatus Lokiarchaeota archaeon]|nr:hypothetical protein [Candidatus Lokiarchaeota archaeon]
MFMKIRDKFNAEFHMIFNKSHIFYTVVFLIIAAILGLCSFSVDNRTVGDISLFIATMFFLAFFTLMILGIPSATQNFLFSTEKIINLRKFGFFVFSLILGLILTWIYWAVSDSIPIEFLRRENLLPIAVIIIFLGWNMIQIFFIKTIFENVALKVDNKLLNNNDVSSISKSTSFIFLVIALIIPVLMQIATFIGYWEKFDPNQTGNQDLFYWFVGWNVLMFGVIVLVSWRLIYLFYLSRKNETYNVFSSIFYIFIWLIIWFRSFSFINSLKGVVTISSSDVEVFEIIIDILLMILTAIMVLRGLGGKIYKLRVFNESNLPFFLFAFVLFYLEGQVVLITGSGVIASAFSNRTNISMYNNFILLIVTIIFYWWYSRYVLEKHNLIVKHSFKHEEVIQIVSDFKEYLGQRGKLNLNAVSETDMETFYRIKKLIAKPEETEQEVEEEITEEKQDVDNPITEE